MRLRRHPILIVTGLSILMAISGCVNTSGSRPPVNLYTFDYAPPHPSAKPPLDLVLRIERFGASPPYNANRMIYAEQSVSRKAYHYHQWLSQPGEMMAFFLSRDFQHTGVFKAVAAPGSRIQASHVLTGWVEEFSEQDLTKDWSGTITVNITLMDMTIKDLTDKIVFQKAYRTSKPCPEKTPAGLAQAMSDAMASLSAQLFNDVYHHLAIRPKT